MKALNDTKRTRFKVLIYFGSGILALGVYCAINEMEGGAVASITALGGIIAKYCHDESKRPSIKTEE